MKKLLSIVGLRSSHPVVAPAEHAKTLKNIVLLLIVIEKAMRKIDQNDIAKKIMQARLLINSAEADILSSIK